jgi:hypothetical protein
VVPLGRSVSRSNGLNIITGVNAVMANWTTRNSERPEKQDRGPDVDWLEHSSQLQGKQYH